jgi:hypothetical protein
MRISNPNIGATSVMFVVMKKRAKLLALLTKNGVKYPANATDIQLALIVTSLLKTSKSFRKEFEQLVTEEDVIVGVFSGMDGAYSNFTFNTQKFDENIFSNTGATSKPYTFGSTGTKPTLPAFTTTSTTDVKKDKKFSLGDALGLLQTGFAGYLALDDNKTKKALADASVQIKQNDVELGKLGILPDGNTPKKEGLSTGAIIGISIAGIVVVGGAIYFAMKNKAQ